MKKRFGICAITLVIVGLMIAVSASAMLQTPVSEEKTLIVKRTGHGIVLAGMDQVKAETKELIIPSAVPLTMDPVLAGYHPAIASDGLGNIVLGFEDDSPNVWFTASLDGGQTWLNDAAGWAIPEPPELPDIDSCGDGRFIGGMVPNHLQADGGELYKVEISDPGTIPDGYSCPSWDWSNVGDGYSYFDSIAVGGYTAEDPDENTWAYGAHAITGDHGGASGDDTALFSYSTSDTMGVIWRFTGVNGCSDSAMDIDQGNLRGYPAWNFDNGGMTDIYLRMVDCGTRDGSGYFPWVGSMTISSSGNDTYIDISALNDNVIIVSEREGDAVAYYSSNGMSTVSETLIATGASNPRIVHTDDNIATCIFVMGGRGTLYYSETEDGGATWSTPQELASEPVDEDFQRADISGYGAAYESAGTIYFEPHGGAAIIDIIGISGGLGVSADIKNIGFADATDVSWAMTVTGGFFGLINKNKSGVIPTLTVDATETVKSGILLGFGPITVTVIAGEDTESASGMQIIIFSRIN